MKVFDVMITKEFLQQVMAETEEEAFKLAELNLPANHEDFDMVVYKIMDEVALDNIDYGKGE